MVTKIYEDKVSLGRGAAEQAASSLREAIKKTGRARIIAATGASQFEFLEALTTMPGIEWAKVEMFHLDEYTKYHFLDGEGDVPKVVRKIAAELAAAPIDLAFVGIGENGHLAFNDPPADFETEEPYIIVELDEPCRRQQVGEGWFNSLSDVPKQAISMSVRQILKAKEILVVVPDARKAQAVKACFEGEISPMAPASILRTHANTTVFLDRLSSALLSAQSKGNTA